MNRKEYEEDLKRRQAEHLRNVRNYNDYDYDVAWACAHDQCPECIGTGVKHDGSMCIHYLYCSCPKCSPGAVIRYTTIPNTTTLWKNTTWTVQFHQLQPWKLSCTNFPEPFLDEDGEIV